MKSIEELMEGAPGGIKKIFSYAKEGNKLSLAMAPPVNVDPHIEPFKDVMYKVQEELKVDQNIEATIRLGTSPKDLFTEGAEPVLL